MNTTKGRLRRTTKGRFTKGGGRLTREEVIAIYLQDGPQKVICYDFGVSSSHVSRIKNHEIHAEITRPYADTALLNATLATLAFTGGA
jgi:hypothetical protein